MKTIGSLWTRIDNIGSRSTGNAKRGVNRRPQHHARKHCFIFKKNIPVPNRPETHVQPYLYLLHRSARNRFNVQHQGLGLWGIIKRSDVAFTIVSALNYVVKKICSETLNTSTDGKCLINEFNEEIFEDESIVAQELPQYYETQGEQDQRTIGLDFGVAQDSIFTEFIPVIALTFKNNQMNFGEGVGPICKCYIPGRDKWVAAGWYEHGFAQHPPYRVQKGDSKMEILRLSNSSASLLESRMIHGRSKFVCAVKTPVIDAIG